MHHVCLATAPHARAHGKLHPTTPLQPLVSVIVAVAVAIARTATAAAAAAAAQASMRQLNIKHGLRTTDCPAQVAKPWVHNTPKNGLVCTSGDPL